jgi:hypothetical protein
MRLLLLVFLAYLAYAVARAWLRLLRPRPRGTPPPAKSGRGEEMVRDPHCGTYLPRGDALTKTVRGTTRYFCSGQCRDAYRGE